MAKSEILIDASPEVVFAYLADLSRHGEWATHPGLVIEPEADGPVGVGSRFVSHGHQFGQEMTDVLTVTGYSTPRELSFESAGKGGVWRHSFELTPAVPGTRLVKRMDGVKGPLAVKLLTPLISLGLSKRLYKDLERIKARIKTTT